jgi:hypothetical protein
VTFVLSVLNLCLSASEKTFTTEGTENTEKVQQNQVSLPHVTYNPFPQHYSQFPNRKAPRHPKPRADAGNTDFCYHDNVA